MQSKTKKKTYFLPQQLIDEMKNTFKVKTETQAIISAMKEISFRSKLLNWHLKNVGKIKIKNIYG